jgi:hypothetical protein
LILALRLLLLRLPPPTTTMAIKTTTTVTMTMTTTLFFLFDHFTSTFLSIDLFSDGKLQSPTQLRAPIMHPLELVKAAAWFFALQSQGMKQHR